MNRNENNPMIIHKDIGYSHELFKKVLNDKWSAMINK